MKKNSNRPYKITMLIILAIIALMVIGVCSGCQKYPYYRNEISLSFPVDSLTKLPSQLLPYYLGRPTSDFDSHKSWLVYINGQRYLIVTDLEKTEIIR